MHKYNYKKDLNKKKEPNRALSGAKKYIFF
jgi:hypothetical protein